MASPPPQRRRRSGRTKLTSDPKRHILIPKHLLAGLTSRTGRIFSMTKENEDAVRDAFTRQAESSLARGSPFTALLSKTLSRILDRQTEVGRRVLEWPGRPDARGDS